MVFVKVRETYDLHTVRNKMSVIAVHTPDPKIIKANFPGLLMQCKAYRPYSCDIRVACASMLPVDPQGVGTAEGDIAPEDMFNPILYSAMSNFGMSQLEARINEMAARPTSSSADVVGNSAVIDVDSLTTETDEFPIYYGLLSNAHGWKHANPQSGLQMSGLKPYVYELLYNIGDTAPAANGGSSVGQAAPSPTADGSSVVVPPTYAIRGNGKPMPMINCTSYTVDGARNPFVSHTAASSTMPDFHELDVPWIKAVVAGIIVPPSRLHELFYRMVVEWTIEFSTIRSLSEVCSFNAIGGIGNITHWQNYDYSATKAAITGDDASLMDKDSTMVSANVEINKVM